MNEEKLAKLKRLYNARELTLNEMAQQLNVSHHTFKKMRIKLGLTDRYVKKFKPQQEITPEELAERAAQVRAKALAHKKKYGRPDFRPSEKPGYKFCKKHYRFDVFER